MAQYYLRMEVMNFDWIVDDTLDLSTIRGGSLLALNAPKELRERAVELGLAGLEDVSAGASIGWFRFEAGTERPAEAAERARLAAERHFSGHRLFRHLTIVFDVIAATADFQRDREALLARNRFHQLVSPSLAWPQRDEAWVCNKDGLRPATAPQGMSASVRARHRYGAVQKQKFYSEVTGVRWPWRFAYDLDELTACDRQGNLHHKMAVVYLDGNKFSTIQRELCLGKDEQVRWDACVRGYRSGVLKAMLECIDGSADWLTDGKRARLETLLWGGDDIAWVVPAWKGWWLLNFFFQHSAGWQFEGVNAEGQKETRHLTHSAGVVFCHHNASIHDARRLAKKLCDHAKKQRPKTNCVAYQVLESFDHIGADVEAHRLSHAPPLHPAQALRQLVLPAEPLGAIGAAWARAKQRVSRKKLHQLMFGMLADKPAPAEKLNELAEGLRLDLEQNDWDALERAFGPAPMLYYHLNELWDYAN